METELDDDGIALGRALHQANANLRDLLNNPDSDLADIANACDAAAHRYDEFAEHLGLNEED